MAKFSYSTKLNPSVKTDNRVSLIGNDLMLAVVEGKRYFFNIDVEQLPFTPAIRKAHQAVLSNTEQEYFNIGTRPEQPFDLQHPDLLHINYIMFLISLRQAHARHTWFTRLPQYFTSYVREDIMSGTFIHRLKLVTLQALHNGFSPRKNMRQIKQLYRANGIPKETAMLYLLYWISGEAQRTIETLLNVQEPFILDCDSLIEEANIIISESNLESLASYEANTTLPFLARANRYSVKDFTQDLVSRSRQVYLHCRPFLSRQHSINYARSVVSTYSLRMIHHYQDPVRSRLLTDENGVHDNRIVTFDEKMDYLTMNSSEDEVLAHIDSKIDMMGSAFFVR